MTPKKPTRTEAVEVGRRLTKRQQTRVQTERGHVVVLDPLDPDESMNMQRIKAKAIALLQAAGVEAEPIESALDRVRAKQQANDRSHDDDSLVGLAAQSLRHIHQLEIIATDFATLGSLAPQHAYAVGRLSMLMRERLTSTQQTRGAGLKRAEMPPPGSVETDDGKVTKKSLVSTAIDEAGPGAGFDAVWTQLLGVLDSKGLGPVENGAKDERVITCKPLDPNDKEGKPVNFAFRNFKSMVSKLLKEASSQKPKRGRPKGK